MNGQAIQVRSGEVILEFYPHFIYTWSMWGQIIAAIHNVFYTTEFVACNFVVKLDGLSDIYGSGFLADSPLLNATSKPTIAGEIQSLGEN